MVLSLSSFNLIYYTELSVNIFLYILNVAVCIFLCAQWRKKQSIFHSAYFYILNSYYIVVLVFNVVWVYLRTTNYRPNPILTQLILIQWYCQSAQGAWELVLGLSRCTALAFPNLHKKLWEGKRWIIFMVFIYISPFLAQGYTFFNFACKFQNSGAPGCLEYRQSTNASGIATLIATGVGCILLVLIGIIFSPKGYNETAKTKMEKRLMFQTGLSGLFTTLLYIENYFPLFTDSLEYKVMSYLFWMIQYYLPMLIIFVITPTIRDEFISFFFSWLKVVKVRNASVGSLFSSNQQP